MGYVHTNSRGIQYHLNTKVVTLRGNKEQSIFYFSKDERPEACDMPEGYIVVENKKSGFLTLKKDR
jgi:hypothetical protein